jgi:hypothetical protein
VCAAGADANGAGDGIDAHAFHHRHVDHQPAIDATKAGPVVPTSADGNSEIALPCKIDCSDNVSDVGATRNHHGTLVDHPVVEASHCVIVGIHWPDNRTAHVADEGFGGREVHDFLLLPHNDA